jgi:drug/metabolite transporter (DMT)-like permease
MTLALALLGSLMWGVADFLGGLISKTHKVAFVLVISQTFGLLTMLVYFLIANEQWDWRAGFMASLASFAGFFGIMSFYKALATGTMGIVSPIASLGAIVPVVVGLASGEQPSGLQFLGIMFALLGVALASGPELSGASAAKPVLLAIGAAIGFGTCFIFLKEGGAYSVSTTMILMRVQSVIMGLFLVWRSKAVARVKPSHLGLLVLVGAFDVLANVTFTIASQSDLLALVSVLSSLYPVVTVLMAWVILKERLMAIQYVGIVIALFGVCQIALG